MYIYIFLCKNDMPQMHICPKAELSILMIPEGEHLIMLDSNSSAGFFNVTVRRSQPRAAASFAAASRMCTAVNKRRSPDQTAARLHVAQKRAVAIFIGTLEAGSG